MDYKNLKSIIREVVSEIIAENETAVKNLSWQDGLKIGLNSMNEPIGYKYLGTANSGVKFPETDDWRRFYVSSSGNTEKFLSPKLKGWYDLDSSG